ncbi:MAG: tetratricopeptide repeat protein, partial [Gemmatimonadales bacterium]
FLELGQAYTVRRDREKALDYFRRAYHLAPNAALAAVIRQIETEGLEALLRPAPNPPQGP